MDFRAEKQLIVVASLITKATNLGGLCRTCEIFGVTSLILSNSAIVADAEFRSLSMSSQKWVNIQEVRESDLRTYLAQKTRGIHHPGR
uniref:tRNA/rRNA methyltransferase SpoU type domain-containing protein n=1 Tax=Ditylenchus dipsaci TaxID=166011 RepID=A0A915DVV5_9BILA